MKFINLTRLDGHSIYVRHTSIDAYEPTVKGDGYPAHAATVIILASSVRFAVKDTLDAVRDMLASEWNHEA